MQRRYVWGAGTDEPLVWYEGTGLSTRHYYHTDERGSVIALSNSSGALTDINRYDEYGIPGSNAGRFQYTGQQWISELGMYYYRARTYSPTLGRFLQTDPIGYGAGMNLYAYALNDPINFTDPSGLAEEQTVVVTGRTLVRLLQRDYQRLSSMEFLHERNSHETQGQTERLSGDGQGCDPIADPEHCAVVTAHPGWYFCAGGTYFVATGVCMDGNNHDFYLYVGLGAPIGFDALAGYSEDPSETLGGFSISGQSPVMGGNVNLSQSGARLTALQVGTPGVQVVYSVNFSVWFRTASDEILRGVFGPINDRLDRQRIGPMGH